MPVVSAKQTKQMALVMAVEEQRADILNWS